jgi:hypothetical protein
MNSLPVLVFLLTITAFYAFLSIYILVSLLTRQAPEAYRRRRPLPEDTRRNANSRALW